MTQSADFISEPLKIFRPELGSIRMTDRLWKLDGKAESFGR